MAVHVAPGGDNQMAITALNTQNLTQAVTGLQQAFAGLKAQAPAAQPGFNMQDVFQKGVQAGKTQAAAAQPPAADPAKDPAADPEKPFLFDGITPEQQGLPPKDLLASNDAAPDTGGMGDGGGDALA